jgi:hypothetical protein
MLLQSCIPTLFFAHGAIASSYKGNTSPVDDLLHNGHEYSAPQIEVLPVSSQTNNDLAMMTSQENDNYHSNTTGITLDQIERNASNTPGSYHPERMERLAELESAGIEFSPYLYWEEPEGCPSLQPECEDCGGMNKLWHRDVLVPSPRCSGVSFSFPRST